VKYKPTPRDLFNPPPQALCPQNLTQHRFDLLYGIKSDMFTYPGEPMDFLLTDMLDMLEEIARRTGSVK
jgi:hypothetical protein